MRKTAEERLLPTEVLTKKSLQRTQEETALGFTGIPKVHGSVFPWEETQLSGRWAFPHITASGRKNAIYFQFLCLNICS